MNGNLDRVTCILSDFCLHKSPDLDSPGDFMSDIILSVMTDRKPVLQSNTANLKLTSPLFLLSIIKIKTKLLSFTAMGIEAGLCPP